MEQKRKLLILILVVAGVVGGAYWWLSQPSAEASEPEGLFGSGTIEAETVAIVPELGGRVMALKVAEGEEVTAGQGLIELDKSELLAQQSQLKAALNTARANLESVSAPPQPEEIAAAEAELAQAKASRDGTRQTWQRLRNMVNNPNQLDVKISQARTKVTEAQENLEMAQVKERRLAIQAEAASRNQSNHAALVENEVAQHRWQSGQTQLQMAEVALAGAKEQVQHWLALRNRPLQLIAQANAAQATYQQAEAAVEAAETNLAAVKAGPTPEAIAVAKAQVRETEAALATVEVQLDKQSLTAPRAGLISQTLIDPGELARPGEMLLELSDLDTTELTVYIPETQIGQVKLGQKARVYVDAYAGEQFEGTVSFIAHQAEFTPKNVQTKEERVNLVFAVEIDMENPDHRLRPGMPADAEILPGTQSGDKAATATLQAKTMPTPTATPTPFRAKPTLTAIIPTPTPTEEPTPTTQAQVVVWSLNVRRGPGTDHPAVASLNKGQTVPVLNVDPTTGWLEVALPTGETGWISGRSTYVSILESQSSVQAEQTATTPSPSPTSTPTPDLSGGSVQAEVVSVGLNVRSGPGLDQPVIANLAQGYTMPVLDVDPTTGWLQVELPGYGTTGWVSGDPTYVAIQEKK